MPLMVHSTCRAPAATAASEFATASPRSLWQWAEIVTFSIPARADAWSDQLAKLRRHGVADCVRNVDRGCARFDHRFSTWHRKS